MNGAMLHRGPDDEGYFVSGRAGLAMRRLSIIDIARGHQPMENELCAVVFNGEIYNYIELKEELKEEGPYSTDSDTEVILKLYKVYGPGFIKRLRGMFAIALYDKKKGELFVVRDHAGIKPLYYSFSGGDFIFASELKALLKHPGISRELDPKALDCYLTSEYNFYDGTVFKGIFKVPPGHYWHLKNTGSELKKYWDLDFSKKSGHADPASELYSIFNECVRLRLRADVPVGMLLSGGMDSNLTMHAINRLGISKMHTFTVGYKGDHVFDETEKARKLSAFYDTEHHEVKIDLAGFRDYIFGEYPSTIDEPLGNESNIPLNYLYGEAKKYVTVLLSGLGGDELFFGYPRHHSVYSFIRKHGRESSAFSVLAEKVRSVLMREQRLYERLRYLDIDPVHFLRKQYVKTDIDAFIKHIVYGGVMKNGISRYRDSAVSFIRDLLKVPQLRDISDILTYLDMKIWIASNALISADIISMAHSLELRVPFFDIELLNFYCTLSEKDKFFLNDPKRLEKMMFPDSLPAWVTEQPKQCFNTPMGDWMLGSMKNEMIKSILENRIIRVLFSREGLERYIGKYFNRYPIFLWRIFIFSRWAEHYF